MTMAVVMVPGVPVGRVKPVALGVPELCSPLDVDGMPVHVALQLVKLLPLDGMGVVVTGYEVEVQLLLEGGAEVEVRVGVGVEVELEVEVEVEVEMEVEVEVKAEVEVAAEDDGIARGMLVELAMPGSVENAVWLTGGRLLVMV